MPPVRSEDFVGVAVGNKAGIAVAVGAGSFFGWNKYLGVAGLAAVG